MAWHQVAIPKCCHNVWVPSKSPAKNAAIAQDLTAQPNDAAVQFHRPQTAARVSDRAAQPYFLEHVSNTLIMNTNLV
jgi:hypothetical protein